MPNTFEYTNFNMMLLAEDDYLRLYFSKLLLLGMLLVKFITYVQS